MLILAVFCRSNFKLQALPDIHIFPKSKKFLENVKVRRGRQGERGGVV